MCFICTNLTANYRIAKPWQIAAVYRGKNCHKNGPCESTLMNRVTGTLEMRITLTLNSISIVIKKSLNYVSIMELRDLFGSYGRLARIIIFFLPHFAVFALHNIFFSCLAELVTAWM